MGDRVLAVRAVLWREDGGRVQFELHRTGPSSFEMIEDGRVVGVSFQGMELRQAWEQSIARRYPGYRVSDLEEWVPEG